MAPYLSSQNGLAECAIRTLIEDVQTLLNDSGLGHSYWAKAAAYLIYTQNLIPHSVLLVIFPWNHLPKRDKGLAIYVFLGQDVGQRYLLYMDYK